MGLFSGPKMAQVEFEFEGRTYRVEVAENALLGSDFGGSHHETDLLTGQRIIVNWGQVGVFRVVQGLN